jgi:hypothetical protein
LQRPNTPGPAAPATDGATGDVDHYIVGPTAYRAVVHVLEQIPYGQIAATMRLLERDTTPVLFHDKIRELRQHEQRLLDLADVVSRAITALDERRLNRSRGTRSMATIANMLADAYKTATLLDVERVETAKKE